MVLIKNERYNLKTMDDKVRKPLKTQIKTYI